MGRLAAIRDRLTYANVVATTALFLALGGASYAAMELPPNSVGTRQLSFPIGQTSQTGPDTAYELLVCPWGAPCPAPMPKTLASVHVLLHKPGKLFVLGLPEATEGASSKSRRATLNIRVEVDRNVVAEEQSHVTTQPTMVAVSGSVSILAGHHLISLVAAAETTSGPRQTLNFAHPQLTVIALPSLH